MRRTSKPTGWQYEHGVIAIEAAIVLPVLLLFIGFPSILLAFYYRQYSAAEKAAHDAALYLSTAPRIELTTAGPDGNFVALTVAKKIAAKEMAGVVSDQVPVDPFFGCTYLIGAAKQVKPCTPAMLKFDTQTLFRFDVGINVPYINPVTGSEVDTMYISTLVPVRYMGN